MNRWVKIFLHIFLGLALGSVVALVYICSSESFRQRVAQKVEIQFQKDYGCQLSCRLEKIDWWSLKMVFSRVAISPFFQHKKDLVFDASVKACDDNISKAKCDSSCAVSVANIGHHVDGDEWSLVCEKLTARATWWHVLTHGRLKLSLDLEGLVLFESFEKQPVGLVAFCGKLLDLGDASFVVYDGVVIKDGLLYLRKEPDEMSVQIPFACNIQPEKKSTRLQAHIHDGCVQRSDVTLVRGIVGSLTSDLAGVDMLQNLTGQIQLNYFAVPFGKSDNAANNNSDRLGAGFIAGKIENGVGEFVIKSEDGAIIVDPIKIQCQKSECFCSVGLSASSELMKYFDVPDFLLELSGKTGIELSVDLYDFFKTFQVSMLLGGITYKSKSIFPGGKLLVSHHDAGGFFGTIQIVDTVSFDLRAMFGEDKKSVEIVASNVGALQISSGSNWVVEKNDCNIVVARSAQDEVTGRYDLKLHDVKLDEFLYLSGCFEVKNGKVLTKGTFQDVAYEIIVQLFPDIVFEKLYGIKDGHVVLDFKSDQESSNKGLHGVMGKVDFSLLRDVVPEVFKMSFAQDGSLVLSGCIKDGVCLFQAKIEQACMRIPVMYNVIQGLSASCELDLHQKKIVFKDVDVSWYEGRAFCSRATVFVDYAGACSFVHAPLMLQDLMFSWDRGVYTLVSGRLLLKKENTEALLCVEGQLMLQKSELKENLFSCEFQEMLAGGLVDKVDRQDKASGKAGFNCVYDIAVFTKDALHIKTSFLSARAIVDLCIKGSLKKPELSGAIQLMSGSLFFPYKPLEIAEGKLLFIPEQPFDPVVELLAKGKLKRFGVSMKAWGSALDPHVQFEAQPYLSEEQIVSLLLLGVENNSLGMMVPAFLIQKLNEIIFGPALSKIKLKAVFDRLLKSLRYFRFLPQFTNQTGRGGMRGIFEIDASENLQGKIDTNFMQIEDTKFDIDYAVTDDVTLRLQKDGPSTYGGEVEFRWKFS